jgi:putative transposase
MCRYLYNWNLVERTNAYTNNKISITYKQQQNALVELKRERPWFKGVHSQVLQDVLHRLDNAFKNFFRRVKKNEVPGYPRFKKKGQWNSITYPQNIKRPVDSKIFISKVGLVKVKYHRDLPETAKLKTMTIIKEAGKWFVCFSFEDTITLEPKQTQKPAIGIDMGLIDFYYASDGTQVTVPKFFRKSEKRLKRLQRRFSKVKKYSPKWYKILASIQRCHYKIKCQRKDFLHKNANKLLDKSDIICIENLSIKNMAKRPHSKIKDGKYVPNGASAKSGLNKSIFDVGWGMFFEILRYKAVLYSKKVIGVKPHYTSQICSACGRIVKKSLSTRTHCCECGYIANRDYNAALNILRIGMDSLQALT